MNKVYEHQKYEEKIYDLWEKSGAFTPQISKHKSPFTIIMPPPNANDDLHIGHARFVTIQDVLIRYQRMKGVAALWLPGADHAGIETQYVFEKMLKEKGKSRFDYDQDTLYKMIWGFTMKYKGKMENQLRRLGASCDWTRNKFTLDKDIIKIVYKTFKKLYDDGHIYRGERIVNYCPRCGTSFSELEVKYKERDDHLYYLDYKTVVIATTRPETIFADVAVAVNPKDKRYKKIINQKAVIPLVDREIPIIKDSLVDPDFGTGALKITPGHDSTDFEIGKKHKLTILTVIDAKGKIINTPAKYVGLTVQSAREEVVKDLKNKNLIKKVEKIHHTIGTCYRCKGVIEPMISKQWFLKVDPLVKKSLSAMNKKEVTFTAKKFEKIARHWYRNLRDWNISRQIVWGIRIPAWRCEKCLEWTITDGTTPKKCGSCAGAILTQDTDTFDTWFSSGQWPFATLKASKPGDFDYFYPTSVMETAYDILPFWVIRMIMLGLYATGKVPFREVLIHGLVRDKHGEKISKSIGNVINPLVMVDKYGADALRMGLIWGALVENDISLSEDNIRAQRNFANKLWNIGRFLQTKFKESGVEFLDWNKLRRGLNQDDKKMIKERAVLVKRVTKAFEKYRLNEAAEMIYDFTWHSLADKYIESVKTRVIKGNTKPLSIALHTYIYCLKLLHPFMPFVTEVIWQEFKHLRKYPDQLLLNSSWPQ